MYMCTDNASDFFFFFFLFFLFLVYIDDLHELQTLEYVHKLHAYLVPRLHELSEQILNETAFFASFHPWFVINS